MRRTRVDRDRAFHPCTVIEGCSGSGVRHSVGKGFSGVEGMVVVKDIMIVVISFLCAKMSHKQCAVSLVRRIRTPSFSMDEVLIDSGTFLSHDGCGRRGEVAGCCHMLEWFWPTLANPLFGQYIFVLCCGCCGCCGRSTPGPALRRTSQNFGFFFSLSHLHFVLFLSLGVFTLNFGGVVEGRDPQMCTFGLSNRKKDTRNTQSERKKKRTWGSGEEKTKLLAVRRTG